MLLCLIILLGAFPAWSQTYTVNNINGLTNTLSSANDGDIIILASGDYDLDSTLTINKSITLRGNTSSDTIIQRSSSATSKFRNINISGSAVILQNLTIQNASSNADGGGIYYNVSNGTLSIDNCIITNNAVGSSYSGGGIYSGGIVTITNSTITDNNANNGGGGIFNESTATITNCTITENTANNDGQDIYTSTNISALNTLIWNSVLNENDVIYGTVNLTNCATPSGIGTNPVTLTSWSNPVSSSVEVNGVTHTVFTIENNTELQGLVGKGIQSGDQTPATDQIGTLRASKPTIGAIEGASISVITISCDVDTLEITKGYSRDITLSADLEDDYKEWPISWSISPDVSGITISNDGVLTVGESVAVGVYSVDIIAAITSGDESYSDNKTITVSVYPYPVIVISQASASGTAGSAFTQTLTANITVNSADYTVTPVWSYSGNLPEGIRLSNDKFVGTPTQSGDYEITIKVSADVTTIDSHDIIISSEKTLTLNISAATVTISGTPAQSGNINFSAHSVQRLTLLLTHGARQDFPES
ncbi:MAG: DUF4957 domain-containing protein [Synergistaceae bacterium]|nr:DUF4957 domain-containing protein [Synergistaceae bacterium]